MIKCVYKTEIQPSILNSRKKPSIERILPEVNRLVGSKIYFNREKVGRIDYIRLKFDEDKKMWMEIRYVVTSTPAIEKMIKDHEIGLSTLEIVAKSTFKEQNKNLILHLGRIHDRDKGKEKITHEIFISGE